MPDFPSAIWSLALSLFLYFRYRDFTSFIAAIFIELIFFSEDYVIKDG
jgi:hypothetical protein